MPAAVYTAWSMLDGLGNAIERAFEAEGTVGTVTTGPEDGLATVSSAIVKVVDPTGPGGGRQFIVTVREV